MANYTRNTLTGSLGPVNSELEKIEQSIKDKLDRNPSSSQPNELLDNLDANSNRITNLGAPNNPNDAARLKDVTVGSILPEHITRITLIFEAYFKREVPARSAPVYEHQLHRNDTIVGSNSIFLKL